MGAITRGIANNVLGTGEIDATDGVNGVIPASNVNNTSFGSVTSLPALSGTITTVAGDPPAPSEGQVWYNSVAGALKYNGYSGAWASGGNLNTARSYGGGAGTQDAALMIGGTTGSPTTATEEYDGSTWTAGGTMGTTRAFLGGAGTQTAAIGFGGEEPGVPASTATEEYNGTAWTAGGSLPVGRYAIGGVGLQTATVAFNGAGGSPPTARNNTDEYDGSTWTAGNTRNISTAYLGGAGIQTAAVAFGGTTTIATTEEYDGTSWSSANDMNTGRQSIRGMGLQTAAMAVMGTEPAYSNKAEDYDGTTWTATTNLSTARQDPGTSTNAPSSLGAVFGGYNGSYTSSTEEFSISPANVTISES